MVTVAALALFAPAARGADEVAEQRSKVQSVQSRVTGLEQRLASLLREMQGLEDQLNSTSARLGFSQIQLLRAEDRVEAARLRLSQRARRAYMTGGGKQVAVLLRAQTFLQLLSFSRILGATLQADAAAHREMVAARDGLEQQRGFVGTQRQDLLEATRRLSAVRTEIQSALASEQAILSSAQAELDRLLAARRRAATRASPAVEARRAARQVILDQRLAALLAWYAPGYGTEPFMPPNLKGTGIVTSGLSSWYGPGFDLRRASSGATYHMNQLTAASLVLPFGTLLKVTMGTKSAVVVITDRGPYIAGRVLDLSWGAAEAIGLSGVKQVRMEILLPTQPAPPFP